MTIKEIHKDITELMEVNEKSIIKEMKRLWPKLEDETIIVAIHKYMHDIDIANAQIYTNAIRELSNINQALIEEDMEKAKGCVQAAKYYVSYLNEGYTT